MHITRLYKLTVIHTHTHTHTHIYIYIYIYITACYETGAILANSETLHTTYPIIKREILQFIIKHDQS